MTHPCPSCGADQWPGRICCDGGWRQLHAEAMDEIKAMRAELESQERVAEGLRARDGERIQAILACQYAHELLTKAIAKTGSDRRHYVEAAQAVVRSAGWPGGVIPGAPASE